MSGVNTRRSAPGVFTCQTCNALFTCLEYYQMHRKQHAESSGVKLLCCKHCPYSTENQFHFNWHVMSHTGEEIHSCSVCNVKLHPHLDSCDIMNDGLSLPSSSNHHLKSLHTDSLEEETDLTSDLNHGDDHHDDLFIGKRSVATMATDTDDLLVLTGSTDHRLLDASGDLGTSDHGEDPDDATITFLTSNFSPSTDKKFHELAHFQMAQDENGANYNGHHLQTHAHQNNHNDISDEEDDEEEEIESEEDDDGIDDFVPSIKAESNNHHHHHEKNHHNHVHVHSQESEHVSQGSSGHEQENCSTGTNKKIEQGPPYLKSPNAIPGTDPILGPDGLIQPLTGRGRGKGNRKSRCIFTGENGEQGEIRRKFHCSHCGKSFKTKSHLQRHILTHTGEKPYHCNRCGSKFNQSSSLRNHIIAIHTKEYPHFCPHCKKGFLMPALLTKHLSTNHRNLKKDGTASGLEDGADGGGNDAEEEVELADEPLEQTDE